MSLWRVVGGANPAGIIVRQGKALSSAKLDELLAIGSLVKEVQLSVDRLNFELVKGKGPVTGWVTWRLKSGDLLEPAAAEPESSPPVTVPRQSVQHQLLSPDGRVVGSVGTLSTSPDFLKLANRTEFGKGSQPLPMVGLGCASGVRESHVSSALRTGYRLLDTAEAFEWGYFEDEVGNAWHASGIPRQEICIQTKIHPKNLGFQRTMSAFSKCLARLKTDYVDSLLIHAPERGWKDSWRALVEIYDSGKSRAIGVSNIDEKGLKYLLQQQQKPHVVQNWMDPYLQDRRVREICDREGIQYQSYSTLGTGWMRNAGYKANPVLTDSTLSAIARKHQRDVAQVVLNWANRHGVAVIPASTKPARQKSNLDSFEFQLTPNEMASIDALDGKLGKLTLIESW